jgi:ribosomal protein S14
MTAGDWRKMLKQLARKPAVRNKFIKHNKPKDRTTGIARKKCERCGRFGAMINSYGLNLCRQCFREIAEDVGFKKYS